MQSIRFTRSAAGVTNRRGLIVGVGVAGVAAVAARALPGRMAQAAPALEARPPADDARYQATRHVLRYYETAKS